jgi:hypothetical protein
MVGRWNNPDALVNSDVLWLENGLGRGRQSFPLLTELEE